MLYNLYEAQHVMLTPLRFVAEWQRGWFGHPFSPWAHAPLAKQLAASNDLFLRITQRYEKPAWRIDEVRSPVIFLERSRRNEEGELLNGKMWAELEVTSQTGRRDAAPDRFRRLYLEVEEYIKKTFRKGEPKGFFVGPKAARLTKEGLVLRDSAYRGGTVVPYK